MKRKLSMDNQQEVLSLDATTSLNATPSLNSTPSINAIPSFDATPRLNATPSSDAIPSMNATPSVDATPSLNATPSSDATQSIPQVPVTYEDVTSQIDTSQNSQTNTHQPEAIKTNDEVASSADVTDLTSVASHTNTTSYGNLPTKDGLLSTEVPTSADITVITPPSDVSPLDNIPQPKEQDIHTETRQAAVDDSLPHLKSVNNQHSDITSEKPIIEQTQSIRAAIDTNAHFSPLTNIACDSHLKSGGLFAVTTEAHMLYGATKQAETNSVTTFAYQTAAITQNENEPNRDLVAQHVQRQENSSQENQPTENEMVTATQEEMLEVKEEVMDCEPTGASVVSTEDAKFNISATSVPKFLSEARGDFKNKKDNFLRGCKWSPDGTSVVTNSEDNTLRLFSLQSSEQSSMCSSAMIKKGSQIYDFAWLPDSQRIITTCSGVPMHMWNTVTGKTEANYVAYDQYDEITAAHSLALTLDGRKLYAGYNKAIRVFDIENPGRTSRTIKTFDKKKREGQSGIISCFAMSPNSNGVYVAGSYDRHIGIYDSNWKDQLVWLLEGQQGGVTHLKFSPDGLKLYSGGRKDAEILCWDMRNTGKVLYSVLREVRTNQRIYFDLSESGRYLTTGNHDGSVTFWDTWNPCMEEVNDTMFLKPCAQFQAHTDTVNGISFNHQHSLLATASGQRHFDTFKSYDSDDSDNPDVDMDATVSEADFSLRLWTIPKLDDAL